MASDEIVWSIINQQFCSFKLKTTKEQTFCRNEYNVTGLCSRQACPLANSRYATIRANPDTGVLYLCMKTIERAHLPSAMWERIRLAPNYTKALDQIDEHLIYWPKFLVHKCKQRLTRLTQVAIRTRKLIKEEERLGETIVPKLAPKIRRREATRERKAEAAAKVERAIERELIERLRSGAYGDRPLNVEEGIWKKVLKGLERGGEGSRDKDLDDGVEEEDEELLEEEYEVDENGVETGRRVEYVTDDDDDDDLESLGDLEEWLGDESVAGDSQSDEQGSDSDDDASKTDKDSKQENLKKRKRPPQAKPGRKTKGPRMEIEYETENTNADYLVQSAR